MLTDPALEARAREIGQALRCVVCQNQSIDDSAAEVAHDMRRAVRERLVAGDSDDQVFAFMVPRYGDYVLLKPPFKAGTWCCGSARRCCWWWRAAPCCWRARRRRRARRSPRREPLSDEEHASARQRC